ncbi:MAG: class I SAM-dependent methyltransferase [Phycisphaeraceae bacterium]|nr:class I SAM-dependent methyltransferase [Phycisphaeraceae bacterium]
MTAVPLETVPPIAPQAQTVGLRRDTCPHPLIEEVYASRRVPLPGGASAPMNVYIPREQGDYLYSLVRHYRPSRTIEVGLANGLSTVCIAAGLEANGSGTHTAIDPFQECDWGNAGLELVHRAGLSHRLRHIADYSHRALADLERDGYSCTFAFVDGAHLFDYVIADFLCIDRVLDAGGLIVFDDSDWPAVRQAIRYILANRAYEVAHPEVVIESRPPTPTMSARLIRRLGRALPRFGSKLRPDFLRPDEELALHGRCIALRKLDHDHRNSQSRCHEPF